MLMLIPNQRSKSQTINSTIHSDSGCQRVPAQVLQQGSKVICSEHNGVVAHLRDGGLAPTFRRSLNEGRASGIRPSTYFCSQIPQTIAMAAAMALLTVLPVAPKTAGLPILLEELVLAPDCRTITP